MDVSSNNQGTHRYLLDLLKVYAKEPVPSCVDHPVHGGGPTQHLSRMPNTLVSLE